MSQLCDVLLIMFLIIIATACIAVVRVVMVHTSAYAGGGGRRRDFHKDLQANPRSKSERAVIKYIEDLTGHSFPTVLPRWLIHPTTHARMELDGYNAKLNIAVEFSGPLHTKWTPSYEPYEKYFERIAKDAIKINLCNANGVKLIVVDASLPSRHWRNYIRSRLADLGLVERDGSYIPAQTATVYRNIPLENELGLVWPSHM